jgi:hypothetical protein
MGMKIDIGIGKSIEIDLYMRMNKCMFHFRNTLIRFGIYEVARIYVDRKKFLEKYLQE